MPPPTAIDSLARKQRYDALANVALFVSASTFLAACVYMADESALRNLSVPPAGEQVAETRLAALPQAEQGAPVFGEEAADDGAAEEQRQSEPTNDLQQRVARIGAALTNAGSGRDLDGVVYISLPAAMAMVGGHGRFDPKDGGALGVSDHGLVRFTADSARAELNDVPTSMPGPARMVGGELYIPAKAMAALYGASVHNSDRTGLVEIAVDGEAHSVLVPSKLFRIEISRGERWLKVFYAGRLAKKYPICSGAGNNTPVGEFHIQNKAVWPSWRAYWGELIPGGSRRNPLGARWLGTTARGRATGWAIGIHGTNQPSSIGRRISGGCIRTYNHYAIELYETIPIGTPVSIHE